VDLQFDYAPVRPPTGAYADRTAAASWRQQVFPATSWDSPGMRILILEGVGGLEIGVITEFVLPVVEGIARGAYGHNFAFGVVTSDEPVAQWVTAVAASNRAPIFLSGSSTQTPRAIRPPGALTATEADTLDAVIALGGSATSAHLAAEKQLEAAAAHNRLTALVEKGYLIRYPRSRRDGDLFVDPGTRAHSVESAPQRRELVAEVELPAEVAASVKSFAAEQGRSPNAVLADAWRAYFESHIGVLNAGVASARVALDAGNRSPDQEPSGSELDQWADAAATRLRGE
jgi:hypothetical protein